MVGGVENSVGSSAYLKGSQLGSGSSASRNKPAESTYSQTESAPVSSVREKDTVSSASEALKSTLASASRENETELQSRNEESTMRTEQTRGSLLDIAV